MKKPRLRLRVAMWVSRRLDVPEGVQPPRWVYWIAGSDIWWQTPSTPIIRHCAECLDVPESDVRAVRFLWDRDVAEIRLWNHRRFEVTGQHMHNTHPRRTR